MATLHQSQSTQSSSRSAPYGVPKKSGLETTSMENWKIVDEFIKSKLWWFEDPCLDEDKNDPLTKLNIPYGAFMLGFDFHLTKTGPKLIEINTNAGGLATVFTFTNCQEELQSLEIAHIVKRFARAVLDEYKIARDYIVNKQNPDTHLPVEIRHLVIIDDYVQQQKMYSEMLAFAEILQLEGMKVSVICPEDLILTDDHQLIYDDQAVDFVYNRSTSDFRLRMDEYNHIRKASLHGQIVLSPHPAAYVRIADKRNLGRLRETLVEFCSNQQKSPAFSPEIIPQTLCLSDKPIEEWIKQKKNWVFKPADGNASKGVYRGDKISASKLKSLPLHNTIAQEYCEPSSSPFDGSKLDFRVFTRAEFILGLATRHFSGQVMEMSSEKSGFKMILPDGICCFPMLMHESFAEDLVCKCADLLRNFINQ